MAGQDAVDSSGTPSDEELYQELSYYTLAHADPSFIHRGTIAIADVVAAAPGLERDGMIHRWCSSIWKAWGRHRAESVELARGELGVE
jgi:hypothetical protein